MGQLRKIESELLELGFQIIGISPERPETLSASVQTLTCEIVSDQRMEAAKAFGIAYQVGNDVLLAAARTARKAETGQ